MFIFFNWLSCPVWKYLYSSWVFYIYSHFPSSVSNYKEQAITCYPGKQRRDLEKERGGEKFSWLFFCCGVSVRMKSWPENAGLCTNPCGNCLCQFIRLSMWTALIIRSLPGDGLWWETYQPSFQIILWISSSFCLYTWLACLKELYTHTHTHIYQRGTASTWRRVFMLPHVGHSTTPRSLIFVYPETLRLHTKARVLWMLNVHQQS